MKDDVSRNRLCTQTATALVVVTGFVIALHVFADNLYGGLSLKTLPTAERNLVEFLLLLPLAALVVCVMRNMLGLASFGTFAPALIGLMFRDWHSLPGLGVFVGLLLTGWLFRRILDRLHLLHVPRAAVLLTLITALLVTFIAIASRHGLPVTKYVSLFPVIVLAGMVERFWLLDAGESIGSSLRTLVGTLVISVSVALVANIPAIPRTLLHYPESLGLVVAGQLLIGRYMGYRLSELWRFRELAHTPSPPPEEPVVLTGTLPWRRF